MATTAVLASAGLAAVRRGQPLPLHPAGSVAVSGAADLLETDEGGAVFVWGMAVSCWDPEDVVARRLAAVQLVLTGAATQVEVAAAFATTDVSVRRWLGAWRQGGANALEPAQRGPKGPSKLSPEVVDDIVERRAAGASMATIGAELGLSQNSVSRALSRRAPAAEAPTPSPGPDRPTTALVPLARPEPRSAERQAARRGELAGARPVICEGAGLAVAGALIILPALAVTGLLETAEHIYGRARAAFYGIGSLMLAMVFATLVGEPRVEGLTRIDPVALGRLLGLDRAPEPKTMRRRLGELARAGRSAELLVALGAHHASTHPEAMGVLYVDGHVRAYHGSADVPKAHVARIRLSMPAELDTWVADANGDGLMVFSAPPGASLVAELRRVAAWARELVGPDRRPTICFDRGGWSPAGFAELVRAGFDILTYRKAPLTAEPRSSFSLHRFVDDLGRRQEYWLADRAVRISYHGARRRFACRQITRLDPATGHQTQVITTRTDADPALLAHAMFSRWRQENFFRYLRAHYGLDALDAYATVDDDAGRPVANPAKATAKAELARAKTTRAAAEADLARAVVAAADPLRGGPIEANARLAEATAAVEGATATTEDLARSVAAVPAKVPLALVRPDAARLDPERKRVHDAVRMATYNAESSLARLVAPHYARADDEARSLLREVFASPADLQVVGAELHVRIHPLSAPRRTRALAALCVDLTATETIYPRTELTLVYSVAEL